MPQGHRSWTSSSARWCRYWPKVHPSRSAFWAGTVAPIAPDGVTVTALNVEQAERDGQVRVWWDDTPIDVFLDVLPLHGEIAREVRRVPFAGRTIPVLGCDALAVFKAMFDRTRDWADIEAMVDAKALDFELVTERIRRLDGEDSLRTDKLLALRS